MNSNPIIQFLINVISLNNSFKWEYVFKYLFHPYVLQGVFVTIVLAVCAQLVGSVIGLLLYFFRRSQFGPLMWFGRAYVLLVRGTPLLVQILFLATFLQLIHVDRFFASFDPFGQFGFSIQVPMDAFVAALAALSINEGAYMAEIVRAGIDAIDTGQMEAAKSLGMTYGLAMRRIVLPQAARVIIPPLGNEFNGMLKNTSLAYVISVSELLFTSYKTFGPAFGATEEFLVIASFWYLVLTSAWGLIQVAIERKLNASNVEPGSQNARSRWQRSFGFGGRSAREAVPEALAPPSFDHR
ncbi:MAG: amino acid ABC transporter permease [Ktedonobacterales bacterium]|nr:amino acid ABC transporter permease [Ktedonobacterales bacterium]